MSELLWPWTEKAKLEHISPAQKYLLRKGKKERRPNKTAIAGYDNDEMRVPTGRIDHFPYCVYKCMVGPLTQIRFDVHETKKANRLFIM
jgi:hypothetical protein